MRHLTRSIAMGMALALVACGGGGGSGGSSSGGSSISISVSPQLVTAAATTTAAAPSATLQLNASSVPSAGLYASVYQSGTGAGIASVSLTQSGNTEDINISFAAPASLGVGVYTDTLTIDVCLDQACTQPVSNSGIKVPITYTVTAGTPATATPSISSLVPVSATAAGSAFVLTVNGGNFASTSLVLWNGSARTTTYVSPTQLTAQITAADILSAGTDSVSVSNTGTGGGVSLPSNFTVSPQPLAITNLSPAVVNAGAASFPLTVIGTGFTNLAEVYWNGSSIITTYVSPTQLLAQVPASFVALATTATIQVSLATSPSSFSNGATFAVDNAPLSIGQISPTQVTAGGPLYTQTVLGTGFTPSSMVLWNGSARTTTYVSSTELLAQVTSSDITSLGAVVVTVSDSGNITATSATLSVVAPSIDAVAFQINPQHTGVVNFANLIAPSSLASSPSWTAILDGPPSYALIAGGKVFVTVSLGTSGSELIALSAATGTKLWGPITLPYAANATYDNGMVFTLSANIGTSGLVSAFDAATGALRWSAVLNTQYWFTAPPTAANGFVYAVGAGSGGTVYALNETTGALAWSTVVNGGQNSSPAVSADGVYVSFPCQSYDLRPLTGEFAWVYSSGCSGGGGGTGAVANGVFLGPSSAVSGVAATAFSGFVFNAETGATQGAYSASLPVAVGSQAAYLMQSGTLRAISLSGTNVLWSFAGDGFLNSAPVVVNNDVFVSSSTGNLYAVDAISGAQVWQANLHGTLTVSNNGYGTLQASGLSAGDGLLIAPSGNTLNAFVLSTNP